MPGPLVILASLSIVGGYVGIPIVAGGDRIGEFLSPILLPLAGQHAEHAHAGVSTELLLMAISVAAASVGFLLAFSWYAKGHGQVPARIAAAVPGVYRAAPNKYYVDEIHETVLVQRLA